MVTTINRIDDVLRRLARPARRQISLANTGSWAPRPLRVAVQN